MSEQATKWIKVVVYKLLKEKNLLHLDIETLIAAGNLGYSQALQRFDPDRGAKLKTFAEHRIRGAVLDEVRKMIGDERVKNKRPQQVVFDFDMIDTNNSIENVESQMAINQMIENFNFEPREMLVLKMKAEGYTIDEIAKELGLSNSRASQLVALVKKVIYNNYDGKLNFQLVIVRCPSCNGTHDLSDRAKTFRCDFCCAPIRVIDRKALIDNEAEEEEGEL